MANTSNQANMFASRPLAELQAENAAAEQAERERRAAPAAAVPATVAAEAPRRMAPVPVLDISFEDLPDQEYEEFNFPLKTTPGVIYTLGLDDDSVLFEIQEVAMEESQNQIILFALNATFRRAVYEDGTEVENGRKMLMDAIDPHRRGAKESRKYLMEVVLSAIDRWTEELTDTSMRPQNRAQRRARSRRR
jgi:hypothetical protein